MTGFHFVNKHSVIIDIIDDILNEFQKNKNWLTENVIMKKDSKK